MSCVTGHMYLFNKTGNIGRNVTSRSVSENLFCCREAISITYSKYMSVALIIQIEKRMRRITCILSSVVCLVLSYLPHYFLYGTIFGKEY